MQREDEALMGWELGRILLEAGLIPAFAQRVVIDVRTDEPVRVYLEMVGTRRLLRVFSDLAGVKVETVTTEEMADGRSDP